MASYFNVKCAIAVQMDAISELKTVYYIYFIAYICSDSAICIDYVLYWVRNSDELWDVVKLTILSKQKKGETRNESFVNL